MAGNLEKRTKNRIRRIIELSLNLTEQKYPFEYVISLYELQIWSVFSDQGGRWPNLARLLVTALLLERDALEVEETDGGGEHDPRPGDMYSLRRMTALLKEPTYRALVDGPLAASGGFSALISAPSPEEFDKEVEKRRKTAETVFEIVDYRFRYFDHGNTDKKMGNLSHAYVFRFNQREGSRRISGSTIRERWRQQRAGAIFLYVSKLTGFDFFPRPLGSNNFLSEITRTAEDKRKLRKFFGQCAYVLEQFKNDELGSLIECFPDERVLPRLRPATEALPLSDGRPVGLENYEMDYANFSDS